MSIEPENQRHLDWEVQRLLMETVERTSTILNVPLTEEQRNSLLSGIWSDLHSNPKIWYSGAGSILGSATNKITAHSFWDNGRYQPNPPRPTE